jgi:hypothetical protein
MHNTGRHGISFTPIKKKQTDGLECPHEHPTGLAEPLNITGRPDERHEETCCVQTGTAVTLEAIYNPGKIGKYPFGGMRQEGNDKITHSDTAWIRRE